MVLLKRPIITNRELDLLCNLRYKGFNTRKLSMTFPAAEGHEGLVKAIERLCREAEEAVDEAATTLFCQTVGLTVRTHPYRHFWQPLRSITISSTAKNAYRQL